MNYKQYEKDLHLSLLVTFLNFFTFHFPFPQFPPLSSPVQLNHQETLKGAETFRFDGGLDASFTGSSNIAALIICKCRRASLRNSRLYFLFRKNGWQTHVYIFLKHILNLSFHWFSFIFMMPKP